MKIVYISNSIIPSRTANSIHVMKMCQAFADNGHEVVLLAPDRYKEYESNVENIYEFYGVCQNFEIRKVSYIYTRFIRNFYYGYKTLEELKNLKPDIVYGRDLYGCFFSSFNYKTIFEAHAPMNNIINSTILNFMNSNKLYQKTVVISEALKNIILKNQNFKFDRVFIAHDGADKVNDFKSKIELKGNFKNLKIGYVGSLYKGKGIEVIEKLSYKKFNDIDFHIVGGSLLDINIWSKKMKSKNIYFYGFVAQKEIQKYLNSFDILLLPNQKIVLPFGAKDNSNNISDFTSPLKMFEYMASKKPIICSNLPVLKEVLNEKNSILVDCEDTDAWIDAIEKLKNIKIREELGKNALMSFTKNYSWKSRVNNILKSI